MLQRKYVAMLLVAALAACDEVDDPIDDNNTPEAVIEAETTGERGIEVELDGSFSSDADGDALSYEWTLQGPAGSTAVLTGANTDLASFVPDAVGSYTVELTVSDGDADDTATHTIVIDVQTLGSIAVDSVIENTSSPAGEADYRIDDFSIVTLTADVVIEPGVTIRMGEASGIDVATGGSLSAVGTEALPIRLVGANDVPGHWNNLEIDSNNSANELTYVEISNGGGNAFGAVYLTGRVAITNSTITESGDYGIEVTGTGQLPDFAGNTFTANELGSIHMPANLLGSLDAGSDYLGGGAGKVVVTSTVSVTGTQTWPAINAPIEVVDFAFIDIQGAVTIEPGALFVMGEASALQVAAGGSLSAIGTTTDTIRFVGADDIQGHWNNIEIDSNSSSNRLSYVEIANGGGNAFGALYVTGTIRVDHTLFRDSGDFGIEATTSALLPDFGANAFTGNAAGPITIPTDLIGSLDGETVYAGNDVDYIDVSGGQTGTAQTWPKTDVPFFLQPSDFLTINSAITVEPGFIMHMGEATAIAVETGGSIVGHGTVADSIRFIGAQATPGYWHNFEFSSNAANAMSYVEFAHGGGNGFGMLYVDGTLTLENSRLHHSGDVAIEVTPSGSFTGTGNTLHDNALAPPN